MENTNLALIVDSCNTALADRPASSKQLAEFTPDDERILSDFLTGERDSSPLYTQFSMYRENLFGKEDSFKHPIRAHKKELAEYKDTILQMKKIVPALPLDKFSDTSLRLFMNFDGFYWDLLDMTGKMYENIVGYAREIAQEQAADPSALVKTEEGRDEVYRRMFKDEATYECFCSFTRGIKRVSFLAINEMINVARKQLDAARSLPIIGPLLTYKADEKLKKIPPMDIVERYLQADEAIDQESGNRIFSRPSAYETIDAQVRDS
jgi:hypothetical protein